MKIILPLLSFLMGKTVQFVNRLLGDEKTLVRILPVEKYMDGLGDIYSRNGPTLARGPLSSIVISYPIHSATFDQTLC